MHLLSDLREQLETDVGLACRCNMRVTTEGDRHDYFSVNQMVNNLEDNASSRVDDTQGLVLADGAESTTILVPADTVYQVWVGITQLIHKLP